MSINGGMDKENVLIYIYTMEYYWSRKKEQNWIIFRDVDELGDCCTEWTKSEREKQI